VPSTYEIDGTFADRMTKEVLLGLGLFGWLAFRAGFDFFALHFLLWLFIFLLDG
jgi:hypothetical protein